MVIGDPIVRAIAQAQQGTTGKIRVHLSKRIWERNPLRRAQRLFERFGMAQTRDRNAILLYLNLRRRRFAVLGDQGINLKLEQEGGQGGWKPLARALSDNLRSTAPERAIALTVAALGEKQRQYFPEDFR